MDDPHRLTVAGAAAALRVSTRAPRSRFTSRLDEEARSTCRAAFYAIALDV